MKQPQRTLQIVNLPVDKLRPNGWNPNVQSEEVRTKLAAYIAREGLVEPLVVRPKGKEYEILGGEHRWRILKEAGHAEIPCVVVELDDRRARIMTVNLNELSGESAPRLLAELLHDLSREATVEDLASQLPYNPQEVNDLLDLLKLPDGLDSLLEDQAQKEEGEAPVIVSVAMSQAQVKTFEEAVQKANTDTGDPRLPRGRAVELMAKAFLGPHDGLAGRSPSPSVPSGGNGLARPKPAGARVPLPAGNNKVGKAPDGAVKTPAPAPRLVGRRHD